MIGVYRCANTASAAEVCSERVKLVEVLNPGGNSGISSKLLRSAPGAFWGRGVYETPFGEVNVAIETIPAQGV